MSRFSHDKSGEAPEPVVELTAEEATQEKIMAMCV